jgi:hypothetical protein
MKRVAGKKARVSAPAPFLVVLERGMPPHRILCGEAAFGGFLCYKESRRFSAPAPSLVVPGKGHAASPHIMW